MKKAFLFVLVVSVFLSCGQNVKDFEIETTENAVSITGYNGTNKKVAIPAKIDNLPVVAIGDNAFRDKKITSITIPESVVSIGSFAFADNKLKSVVLSNTLTYIGNGAFSGNEFKNEVEIPAGVETIGISAFDNNLKENYESDIAENNKIETEYTIEDVKDSGMSGEYDGYEVSVKTSTSGG